MCFTHKHATSSLVFRTANFILSNSVYIQFRVFHVNACVWISIWKPKSGVRAKERHSIRCTIKNETKNHYIRQPQLNNINQPNNLNNNNLKNIHTYKRFPSFGHVPSVRPIFSILRTTPEQLALRDTTKFNGLLNTARRNDIHHKTMEYLLYIPIYPCTSYMWYMHICCM